MKKIKYISLVLAALVLLLCACNNNNTPAEAPSNVTDESSQEQSSQGEQSSHMFTREECITIIQYGSLNSATDRTILNLTEPLNGQWRSVESSDGSIAVICEGKAWGKKTELVFKVYPEGSFMLEKATVGDEEKTEQEIVDILTTMG